MRNQVDIFRFLIDKIELAYTSGSGGLLDLNTFVDKLTIQESMNQMFIQGQVYLTIPKGYLSSSRVQIKAQDAIRISVKSENTLLNDELVMNTTNLSSVFYINRIDRIDIESQIYDKYVLNFTTPEAIRDKKTKVQRSYRNQKRSDIVSDIYNKDIKVNSSLVGNADSDAKDFYCVIPNWTPSKAVNWVKSGCTKNQVKNFYLFQRMNSQGEIETVFDDYKTLCEQPPVVGQESSPQTGYITSLDVQTSDGNNDDLESDYKSRMKTVIGNPKVLEMDMVDKSLRGVWSSTAFFYDITTKKYTSKKFSYKDDSPDPFLNKNSDKFFEDNLVSDFSDLFSNGESSVFLLPKAHLRFDQSETELGVDRIEEWYQESISQKEASIFNAISIELPGDTNRRVGETIMFSNLVGKNYEFENSRISFESDNGREFGSKYLIFALERVFEFSHGESRKTSCRNKMIIVKDGLMRVNDA